MFNKIKSAEKKIKDRHIHWTEGYTVKSIKMKEKFDKVIGPHAYVRYEGHDSYSNSEYYIVIGPSVQNDIKQFFAGIRKLPDNPEDKVYSPYGEYFPTMSSAQSYASKRWGVPFNKDIPNYTKEQIRNVDIPEHIKG